MSLTINLVTRNRPHLLRDTIERTLPNLAEKTTNFIIACDADDPESIEVANTFKDRCTVSVKEREDTLGEKLDRALTIPADAYVSMVDYAPILTPEFDTKIQAAVDLFPDNIGYVYGPLANLSFPCMICVTHGMSEIVGGIGPKHFPYWFWDHWIDDLARMTGRLAYVNIEVDFSTKRPDKTLELRDVAFWASFFDITACLRKQEAAAVIDKMIAPQWHKDLLINSWPLTEQRSFVLNNMVRANARQTEKERDSEPPNERYMRSKRKAEAILRDIFAKAKAA